MKTLKDYLILYDAECPMCSLYTKAFITSGILEKKGRAPYQDMEELACPMIDRQRAANEIALINLKTGEVTYGIRSLFKIFTAAMPLFKPLFLFEPFIWIMSKVYSLVSYNRRVIIPAPVNERSYTLQPAFRLPYRLIYLFVTWAFTAYILSAYAILMSGLLPQSNFYREYFICGGQIFFQATVIQLIERRKRWDYLGNMMTISFAGAILLLPGLLLPAFFKISPTFYAICFLCVAGLMFFEHIRRSKLLKLGWVLTISWVFYRLMVLLLILLK